MKKTVTFLFLLAALTTQAQIKADLGVLAGGGGRIWVRDYQLNNATQANAAVGLDLQLHFWGFLLLVGRAEYQHRYYENVRRAFDPMFSGQLTQKDAIVYQYGLGFKKKWFYASCGFTYSDNLNPNERIPILRCGTGADQTTLDLPSEYVEDFDTYGTFANIGFLRRLTKRSNMIFELNYQRETGAFESRFADPFEGLGVRMGIQRNLFSVNAKK
jgi:hypothetical protein